MKSVVTKLVAMLLVAIVLNVMASGITFITSDPMVDTLKGNVIDGITCSIKWAFVMIHK